MISLKKCNEECKSYTPLQKKSGKCNFKYNEIKVIKDSSCKYNLPETPRTYLSRLSNASGQAV